MFWLNCSWARLFFNYYQLLLSSVDIYSTHYSVRQTLDDHLL